MKLILGILGLAVAVLAGPDVWTAAGQSLPSTAFTRDLLRSPDQVTAQRKLGLGTNTPAINNFLVVTGGVQTASVAWSGPTNPLPLNSWRQHYTTFTPVSLTGFTQKSTTNCQPFILCILNAASTNVPFTPPPGLADLNYASSYIITNGTELIYSGEYDPYLVRTNGLGRIAP